jgi:hypothetical protein
VFAYSNGCDRQRALVVYHNRHGDAAGWIRHSVPKARLGPDGGRQPSTTTLAAALGASSDSRHYYRFRDQHSGQHYLRSGAELNEQGLFLQLGSYQYQVFVDFCELVDTDGSWGRLCQQLGSRPVGDLDRELKRLHFEPLLGTFDQLLQQPLLAELMPPLATEEVPTGPNKLETEPLLTAFEAFIRQLQRFAAPQDASAELVAQLAAELQALSELSTSLASTPDQPEVRSGLHQILTGPLSRVLPIYLLLHRLGELLPGDDSPARTIAWLDDYLLQESLARLLNNGDQLLLIALIRWQDPLPKENPLAAMLEDETVRACLHVHDYKDHQWLCGERLAELAFGLFAISALAAAGQETGTALDLRLEQLWQQAQSLIAAGEEAGYRLDRLQTSR